MLGKASSPIQNMNPHCCALHACHAAATSVPPRSHGSANKIELRSWFPPDVLPVTNLSRMQFSVWNFIRYNVIGGGDSALYGVEDSSFYMRNGANNLNLILVLGLAYPLVALLDVFQITGKPGFCMYVCACKHTQ